MTIKPGNKIITGVCRISYASLNRPSEKFGKYSCVLMIPKSDKKTIKELRELQETVLEEATSSVFGGKRPKRWNDTIKDGDDEDQTDLEQNPEYEGHWYLNVSNNRKPGIVAGPNKEPVESEDEVYSGMYAIASLNCRAYNFENTSKGVTFYLNNLWKVRDGEPLGGGGVSAEEEFEDLDVDFGDDDLI